MLVNEADKRISVTEVLEYMKNNFRIFPKNENKFCENCDKFKTSAEVLEKENDFQANEIQAKEDVIDKLKTQNKELNQRIMELTNENEKLKINKTESKIIKRNKGPQATSFIISDELQRYNLKLKY
jgi:hypothetical protein